MPRDPRSQSPPSEVGAPVDVVPQSDAPADELAPDGAASASVTTRTTAGATSFWARRSPPRSSASGSSSRPRHWGVLVTVFSIARVIGPWQTRALSVVLFVVGGWLAVSSFMFDAPIEGQWNQGLFGGIVALLSLIGLAGAQRGRELNHG